MSELQQLDQVEVTRHSQLGDRYSKGDRGILIDFYPRDRVWMVNFNDQGNRDVAYPGLWYVHETKLKPVEE